jgi:hypothetical protein
MWLSLEKAQRPGSSVRKFRWFLKNLTKMVKFKKIRSKCTETTGNSENLEDQKSAGFFSKIGVAIFG